MKTCSDKQEEAITIAQQGERLINTADKTKPVPYHPFLTKARLMVLEARALAYAEVEKISAFGVLQRCLLQCNAQLDNCKASNFGGPDGPPELCELIEEIRDFQIQIEERAQNR